MNSNSDYLGYIDFFKGIAILSIIMLHALPRDVLISSYALLHIWQGVPLFVFVSFFLIFRKIDNNTSAYYSQKGFLKLYKRIILPFVLFQGVLIYSYLINGDYRSVIGTLVSGGGGPGAYYPHIYIQLWLLAPLLYKIIDKSGKLGGALLFCISLVSNIILYYLNVPDFIERCMIIRYLFLSVVAYKWLKTPDNMMWIVFLPLISLGYWFVLDNYDLNPFIPNKGGWGGQQAPAYFYVYFWVWILLKVFKLSPNIIRSFFEWLGKRSYEIFLMQMLYFLIPIRELLFNGNSEYQLILYCLLSCLISICPVYLYFRSIDFCNMKIKNNEESLYNPR